MVGIHGIGGIGKTTLARAIYNLIADHFEGLCFLDDVREKSSKHGLVRLQETLLYETVGEKDIKLGSVNKGIPIIKQRLHRKKVLLILDDVDELKQLQTMAGGLDWFGLGSRVIVTTRDKHLLASHGIERTYEVCGLEREEALELLMWKAFKNNRVDSSYEDVLHRAVTYASGLPLGLEVVGSNLFGKKVEEWKSTLDRHGRIPDKEIQKILKVSFDGLEEDEQSVFLDIACCMKGYELPEVHQAADSSPDPAIVQLEFGLVDIFLSLCRFEWQAGYREVATALFQAEIEFSLFCPPLLLTEQSKQRLFEHFWNSHGARVGEEGALGWSTWLEKEEETRQRVIKEELSHENEGGGWTGWSKPLSKDKEGIANVENDANNDLAMEGNQDEDEDKDSEPEDDPNNLLKLLGIDINAGDDSEVNDTLTWINGQKKSLLEIVISGCLFVGN